MRIETPYQINDVVTVLYVNGMEVIGRLVEEADGHIVLNKALLVQPASRDESQGASFTPFLWTVDPDNKIKMFKSALVLIHKTVPTIAQQYTKNVSGVLV